MDKNYNRINENIDANLDNYFGMVKEMYNNPEIGFEELKAQKLLSEYLNDQGFDVKCGAVCKTDYIATYNSNKEGPTIGFMCEYDALPEVGHGCGHNMIAPISIGAAVALKELVDEVGGVIKVIGTPAEENFGGKVFMSDAGVFNDLDVALMIHPGNDNSVGGKSTAINPVKFEFFGKNAHACHPFDGRSALDGAVSTYMQINMLRQFVKPGTFIHGIIRHGGDAANIIPAYASMEYYFRAPKMDYALEVTNKAIEIAKGACLAHGLTLKTTAFESPYPDTLINYRLADLMKEKYTLLGLEDIKPVDEEPGGSTDVGSVSYICPTIQGGIKIAGDDVTGHSKEMAAATISEQGKQALLDASKAIAYIACDLITDPDKLEKITDEFKTATAK